MLVLKTIQYHMTLPNEVVGSSLFQSFTNYSFRNYVFLQFYSTYKPNLTIKAGFQEHQVDPEHFLKDCVKKKYLD